MIRLSYIVPVYNASRYLSRCLNSIINQGIPEEEFEVVLVDDGSHDDSLIICRDYEQKYSNIRVLSQDNSGVATARNAGLSIARGQYVCFVDSDDYITHNCIADIFDELGGINAKLIRFWMIILEEDDVEPAYKKGTINFQGDAFEYVAKYGFDTFCVSFLYDRLWLLESSIQFEQFKMAEDYLFISKLLLLNPMIVSTSYRVYNYVKHPLSATGNRSPEHSAACARDLISVVESLMSYSSDLSIDVRIKEILADSARDKMRSFISRVLSSNLSVTEFCQMIRRMKEISILPVRINKERGEQLMISLGINFISTFPFILRPLRFVYVRLFIPLIMPYISKN